MTRVKLQTSARGAAVIAAAFAATAALAAPAVVTIPAQQVDAAPAPIALSKPRVGAPAARVGAVPKGAGVVEAAETPETAEAEADPQPAEPQVDAAAATAAAEAQAETDLREAADSGLRLRGNLPSAVAQNPERNLFLTLSETLSANSNYGLNGDGAAFVSTTRAGLTYSSLSPLSALSVSTGLSYDVYAGPGAPDTDAALPLPDLRVSWRRSLTRTTQVSANVAASVAPQSAVGDQTFSLVETGDGIFAVDVQDGAQQDALRMSLSASSSLSHTINSRNSVSMSASLGVVQYDGGGSSLSGYTQASLSGGWTAQLTPTINGGLTGSYSTTVSDAEDARTSHSFNVSSQANWRVSPRLSLNGSVGPSLTFSAADATSTAAAVDTAQISARVQAGVSYALSDTRWSLNLSNGVTPTTDGTASNVTSLSAGMSYSINSESSASVRSVVTYRAPLGSESDTGGNAVTKSLLASTSLNYSVTLTEDVSASLGYAFNWQDQEAASEVSHQVFLTLSRSLRFVP